MKAASYEAVSSQGTEASFTAALQEEKEGEDSPKAQHHLQAMHSACWHNAARRQDDINTKAQPEASIAGQGCSCKHVVASELPHSGQKLNQSSEEQCKSNCDIFGRWLGPGSVRAL